MTQALPDQLRDAVRYLGRVLGDVIRAQDGQAWPAVYENRELAEKALGRTTAIAPLCFDEDGNVLDLLLDAARRATAHAEGERDEARAELAILRQLMLHQPGAVPGLESRQPGG